MTRATVIIPHLHQWDQLEKCLTSLAQQSVASDSFDIIVADNGSTDFAEQSERIAAAFPHIQLIQELVPGPGPARNAAITLAQTDLILCIDADCRADPYWVEKATKRLAVEGPHTIIGGEVLIDIINPQHPTRIEAFEAIFGFRQKLYIEKKNFSGTGNLAFWKQTYLEIGPFAGIGIAEDVDWGQRAGAKAMRLLFLPDMIVYHPARSSMDELKRKWQRHIAHQLQEFRQKPFTMIKWFLLTFAVSVSWLADLPKIWLSNKLSGYKSKAYASTTLIHIRLFRAKNMMTQYFQNISGAEQWNR